MKKIYPKKLQKGDLIGVIAPSNSYNNISSKKAFIEERLNKEYNIHVEYGKNCMELDLLGSSSIKSRVDDLHNAFKDRKIKAIICATGGSNSNDLLPYINWNIIKNNPKPFIGSSDITVLLNAIYAKTGVVTYFGPNYYKFGMKLGLEYTLKYFHKCLFLSESYSIVPSEKWSEDKWYKNQDQSEFKINEGYTICNSGTAKGKIIGGNLCSFNLLQGTKYMPSLKDSILFI